jgi:hypothetical protein
LQFVPFPKLKDQGFIKKCLFYQYDILIQDP